MTTEQVYQQIIAQLQVQLNQTVPLLPRAFNRILAKVLAAIFVQIYKYGDWQFLQIFVATASNEPTAVLGRTIRPLTEWGRLVGAGDQITAQPAELTVLVTVETVGGTLAAGAQLRNAQTGVLYISRAAVLLTSPVIPVNVRATTGGTAGNLPDGAELRFVNPLEGVAPVATVTATVVTGADAEPLEDYRQRIVDRFQRRPQGGAYADYAEWGADVPGVRQVFPYTGLPGRVSIYVESATEPDRVPTQAQLDAVLEAINFDQDGLASRRPANAFPDVFPVEVTPFTVTVTGLDVPSPAETQADIDAALESYFRSREPFIPGLSIPPRQDRVVTSTVSSLVEQIAADAGGIVSGVSVAEDGFPVTVYVLGEGELADVEAVNYD